MDNRLKNILPSEKAMLAKEEDIRINIDLEASEKAIMDNKIQKILNLTQQFTLERQNSRKFRLQGQVDCLSHFIGIKKTSTTIVDLFNSKSNQDIESEFYNFTDFFDLAILYPEKFIKRPDGYYSLILKPLSYSNDINVFKSGFYKNLFYDQVYQYINESDVDISDKFITSDDNRFVLPINSLYLFFLFKNTETKFSHSWITINSNGNTGTTAGNIFNSDLDNGIFGGVYDLDFENFNFTLVEEVDFSITMSLVDRDLKYIYNPIKEIILQDFSSNVETGSILTTDNIPYYAYLEDDLTNNNNAQYQEIYTITDPIIFSGTTRLTMDDPESFPERKLIFNTNNNFHEYYLDNPVYNSAFLEIYLNNVLLENGTDYILSNIDYTKVILRFTPQLNDQIFVKYLYGENYVWKDLLDIGFIEPDTGVGVDYPFINGYHYLFNDYKLIIKPDFNDQTTNELYCKFVFTTNTVNHNNDSFDESC